MVSNVVYEQFWTDKAVYDDAEKQHFERIAKAPLTPLADEVAKARQRLIELRGTFEEPSSAFVPSVDAGAVKFLEKKVVEFQKALTTIQDQLSSLDARVMLIEKSLDLATQTLPVNLEYMSKTSETEDDVDLFGSDSEEENEVSKKVREERLAAYNEKKSKKPVLIAKSNIILDIKPWDDETDMKAMEDNVRKIEMDGLLWGAAKLVPLAYGIYKLQISCVVEDDKVSIDQLQEMIEANEDYVQSVDIAAFNKI